MRSSILTIALAVASVVACGGPKQQAYNPWLVPQDRTTTFLPGARMIGLAPVTVPHDLKNPGPVQARFDSLIGNELRAAGFTVVAVPEFKSYFDSQAKEHGLFDPATGQLDTAKMRLATEHAVHELQARYRVNAWLTPSIVIVPAEVEGRSAYWDGTKQGIGSVWDLLAVRDYAGTLPALSLCIQAWDSAGAALYHMHGGIELTATRPNKPIEREKLFVSGERNLKAVRIALDPFVSRIKPAAVSLSR